MGDDAVDSQFRFTDDYTRVRGGGRDDPRFTSSYDDEDAKEEQQFHLDDSRSLSSQHSFPNESEYHHSSSAAHLVNGETRFPTPGILPYGHFVLSEAPKSDIATVCSGSVIEDIETSSVHELDPATVAGTTILIACPQQQQQQLLAPPATARSSPTLHLVAASTIAMMKNDMGPPLSRALLLHSQHPPTSGSSRAGSLRSFGSKRSGVSSDVAVHVDTDDCGGSLVESGNDGHSVKSVEGSQNDSDDDEIDKSTIPLLAATFTSLDESSLLVHPLLQNGMLSSSSNGRTSPGGTVYKGRGVRRYQGRYMHLPLKRFHQNGCSIQDTTTDQQQQQQQLGGGHPSRDSPDGCYPGQYQDHTYGDPPREWERGRQRSRSRSPPPKEQERRDNFGYPRKRSWSRSRSRSRTPPAPQRNTSPVEDRTRYPSKHGRRKQRSGRHTCRSELSTPRQHRRHNKTREDSRSSKSRHTDSPASGNPPSNGRRTPSRSHHRHNRKKNGSDRGAHRK